MKLDASIISIFVATFLIGGLLSFVVTSANSPLAIEVTDEKGELMDSVLTTCGRFHFKLASDIETTVDGADIKWKVGDKWRTEPIAEIDFSTEGSKVVELYVDGKLRGNAMMNVIGCELATLIAPTQILKGERHVLKDQTPDAVGWKWFMNGVEMVDGDGEEDQLTYEFRRADKYDLKLLVTTSDGEVKSITKTLRVENVKEDPKPRAAPSNYVSSTSTEPESRETTPYVPPVEEQTTLTPTQEDNTQTPVPEPEPEPVVTGLAFGDYMEEDFSSRENLLYVTKTKNCADFNSDVSVIYISGITTDLCLTHINLLPDPSMKGNSVEITIANSNPSKGRPRKLTRVVQASKNPTSVLVESKGCGLLKGERYTITIRPKGESKFGEVGNGSSCFDTRTGSLNAEIDLGDKTKVLGLSFKHD